LIQAGGNTLRSEIHKLINSIWNKGELPQYISNMFFYIFTKIVNELNVVIVQGYQSLLPTTYKVLSIILLSRLNTYVDKLLGIISS